MILEDLLARARGYSTTTGIDVGHHSIKVVQVQHKGSSAPLVLAADFMELPPGAIAENAVVGSQLLGETLRALLERVSQDGIKSDVVVGINWTNGVLADHMRIKRPASVTEDEAILSHAGNKSPFDDPDVMLDYEVMVRHGDEGKDQELEVLVAAAKKAVLSGWAEFYQNHVQLHPAVMDVDAFALVNTLLATALDKDLEGAVAIFCLGHKRSHCTFLKDGQFQFTREIPDGSVDHFVNVLCRHLGIQSDKAIQALRGGQTEANAEVVRQAVEYAADEIAVNLEMALQYHQSSENSDRVKTIYLTGGGASIPGVQEFLARRFGANGEGGSDYDSNQPVEVKCLKPLQEGSDRIKYLAEVFGGVEPSQDVQNLFTVALGLALRKV